MAPKRRWLKLDKVSKVRVRAGDKNLEVRILIPSKNVRHQLASLHEKTKG